MFELAAFVDADLLALVEAGLAAFVDFELVVSLVAKLNPLTGMAKMVAESVITIVAVD